MTPLKFFQENMIALLKAYSTSKKLQGYVPTIDMLIEDLESKENKEEEELINEAKRLTEHKD